MRNFKSKISFQDCTKFDHILYYGMKGVTILRSFLIPRESKVAKKTPPIRHSESLTSSWTPGLRQEHDESMIRATMDLWSQEMKGAASTAADALCSWFYLPLILHPLVFSGSGSSSKLRQLHGPSQTRLYCSIN